MINLQSLIDDAKCYETVRQLRWPEGVRCPRCNADQVTKQGHDTTQPARQKYHCTTCGRYFDDLTDTVFGLPPSALAGLDSVLVFHGIESLQPVRIAQELGLSPSDVQEMTEQLRMGVVAAQPEPSLSGEVECDEVYVVAGHKGQPEMVKKRPSRASPPAAWRAWAWNPGEGEATHSRDAPTGRGGGHAHARERSTGDH